MFHGAAKELVALCFTPAASGGLRPPAGAEAAPRGGRSRIGTVEVAAVAGFGGSGPLAGPSPMNGIHRGTAQPPSTSTRSVATANRRLTSGSDRREVREASLGRAATLHARSSLRA